MSSLLNQNITNLQDLLEKVNALPEIPNLTNPATDSELFLNKELIDGNGNIITGTFTINEELSEQEKLVSQIKNALDNKSGGITITDATATAGDIVSGKTAYVNGGQKITGTIPTKTSSNLTVSGATVTVPSGYYASQASKSVATITQATPSITVSSSGLITASATQSAGYVNAGTKNGTKQLTTQAAKTWTPTTTNQTIAAGTYCSGTQTIKGDSNLKAENIKKNISIFGITGNYESSAGNGQYYWGKYTVKKNYTVTTTNLGSTKPSDFGSSSYPSYTITDDGYFQLTSGTGYVNTFHLPTGATNGKTKQIYFRSTQYGLGTTTYTYGKATLSDTYTETKGEFIEHIISNSSTTYPTNGAHTDGYWYILLGDENGFLKALPDNITALTTGTFSVTSDRTTSYSITHNLGQKPNFSFVIMKDASVSKGNLTNYLIAQSFYEISMTYDNTNYTTVGDILIGTSNSYPIRTTSLHGTNMTDSSFSVYAASDCKLKAGVTYIWVCGYATNI